MKYTRVPKRLICVLLIAVLFVSLIGFSAADNNHSSPVEHNELSQDGTAENVQLQNTCAHSFYFDFDDTSMTVTNIYEGGRVSSLLEDVRFYADDHYAKIHYNDEEVTDGLLKEGMIVEVYHNNALYGEYTIEKLLPVTCDNNLQANSTGPLKAMTASGNASGFIFPLDNMNLTSNISWGFDPPAHRGIDISWSEINGTPVRAVKDGTVKKSAYHQDKYSWGYYVSIDHGNGLFTLYAHMQENLQVSVGNTVAAGQIIGYVGATGYVQGENPYHLHFEVQQDSNLQNPLNYLHTCTYEYVWYEGTHPHVNYEQCTICGDLRSMGTYAATYEYTYYLTDHPHQQCGMCNICHIEKLTGERKTCNQVGIYASETHPHRRYRVYACGADEWLDSYGECNQVGIYVSETHPHRRYRVYACGADEWLDSYGECNQVGIYVSETHPHRRYRVYACGADEWLDSYGECNQVGIYVSETHPHRRYRVYACGADEWLDSYGTCTCK